MTAFRICLEEFARSFEIATREPSGSKFYRVVESAPTWMQSDDVVQTIHRAVDDRLPDDWIYEAMSTLADVMIGYSADTADRMRDNVHEIADAMVDVYNADRTAWLASHLANMSLVDEACDEFGCDPAADIATRIGIGQFYALDRIANAIVDACESEANNREATP